MLVSELIALGTRPEASERFLEDHFHHAETVLSLKCWGLFRDLGGLGEFGEAISIVVPSTKGRY